MRAIQWFGPVVSLPCWFGLSVALAAGPSPSALIEPGSRVGQVGIGESRGLSVDSSLPKIKRIYPHSESEEDTDWEASLSPNPDKSLKEGLVDQVAGIAFEFRAGARANADKSGYCPAIYVFRPGTTPRSLGSFDQ
jgi:hypothetical protein